MYSMSIWNYKYNVLKISKKKCSSTGEQAGAQIRTQLYYSARYKGWWFRHIDINVCRWHFLYSEASLQTMLNTLHSWCKKWRVLINTFKSECVHFRKDRNTRTDCLYVGANTLETVAVYKYIGVILNEKGDFSNHRDAIGKCESRALESIINKVHNMKEFGFNSYEKTYVQLCILCTRLLFDCLVMHIKSFACNTCRRLIHTVRTVWI